MAIFDLYQHVTDQIIRSLEAGVPAWRKPWTGERGGAKDAYASTPSY